MFSDRQENAISFPGRPGIAVITVPCFSTVRQMKRAVFRGQRLRVIAQEAVVQNMEVQVRS